MSNNITSARYGGEQYLIKEKHDSLTCDECGETFAKPVLATVSSGGSSKTYYACPRCLSKVGDVKTAKSEEKEEASVAITRRINENVSEKVKCEHFLGYLRKRPKNTPIPDECLTCDRMIECLTQ
ncbi:hypothetical protein KEJ45_01165 [Candidatus Bathyarchaeota archaeon]|nr:hypothetical protein [Candidatus Bathyarchaeota archaeon]